jgi:type II secretory pathway pseudopilin PulG
LLAVITIIGVLAGLIVGASKYALAKTRRSAAAGRIAALETVLEDFKADNGYYPKQSFNASPGRTTTLYNNLGGVTFSKKYFTAFTPLEMTKAEILDPFGHEYYYVCPGVMNPATYDLWSAGPDGLTEQPPTVNTTTADDIANWQSNN